MRENATRWSMERPMRENVPRWSIRASWFFIAAASAGSWAAIGAIVRLVA
jgi:hypothetical protein